MESVETRNCVSKLCASRLHLKNLHPHRDTRDILRRRIEQKQVQKNEELVLRSQDNPTLSNWVSIVSNLGYFWEVRSIMENALLPHSAEFIVPIVALIIEQS